jgi:glyoxylase-like metal-dependent hydrolase (beta-lactamase superfamily II)
MRINPRKWNWQLQVSSQLSSRLSSRLSSLWAVSLLAPLLLLAACAGSGSGSALAVKTVRVYVFDCGRLKSANPQLLLARGVTVTDMSVTAYLIVHPRGTLLWDSCMIPDELIKPEGTTVARGTAHKTLTGQLAQIGYKPADITYLALSHNHYDHSANANRFAGSTWLVHRAERAWMFPDKPHAEPLNGAENYSALRNSKTVLLDADHDVFGDGSVVLLATPGHTPGHQSLFVKLAKTGPLVLTGDLYHYPAERTLKDFALYARFSEPPKEVVSKARIEALIKERQATLWMAHDIIQDAGIRKSPAYYE